MQIKVNPDEKTIDEDLKKVDMILVFHPDKCTKEEIDETYNTLKRESNFELIYIHSYTNEGTYTYGIKLNL